MDIRILEHLDIESDLNWGRNGYTTDKILQVSSAGLHDSLQITLEVVEKSYQKTWTSTAAEVESLNALITQGHSFGAYTNNTLAGRIICDYRAWNNSLYIESILISEQQRGQGIGTALIEAAVQEARRINCRIIELETQNTNYPAIVFYEKQGFRITGLNLRLYNEPGEIAIYMTFDLADNI
ncbi:N-acetyltransferase [Pedobacter sp. SYP-B3415]|uniref:GNAT family N-acetyltransferase n=1 Tax=Pedobacter sp. SYP-B3415 TaxID=2496641 RepID=UPI00101E1D35|nr:GNAT family N-acetyltransferase [Pedobacter sp. SYP-B3415]